MIKVFVRKSNCFALVDRGKGMQALQAERSLAAGGDLRGGSNVGQGQIKAADYVLVPDLISSNSRAGGNRLGGMIGGLTGHRRAGAVLGSSNLKKKTADVVLTVTDVRSSEQVAAGKATPRRRTSAGARAAPCSPRAGWAPYRRTPPRPTRRRP